MRRLALWLPILLLDPCLHAAQEGPVPPPAPVEPQVEAVSSWEELGALAFVHLGGTDSPGPFAPARPDFGQWARVAREGDLRGIVLTARYPDGTCLDAAQLREFGIACAGEGLRPVLSFAFRGEESADPLGELTAACPGLRDVRLDVAPADVARYVDAVLFHAPAATVRFAHLDEALAVRADARPAELEAALHGAVARGRDLLLRLPIDDDGRVPAAHATRIAQLGDLVRRTFAIDLAREHADELVLNASNTRGGLDAYGPARACDGGADTYWATDDDVRRAFLDLSLPRPTQVDRVLLSEPAHLGARIQGFRLQGQRDTRWLDLHEGKTIGPRLVLSIDAVPYSAFRLIVKQASGPPALARIGLFSSPARVEVHADETVFLGSTRVVFSTSSPLDHVRYTYDGSLPSTSAQLYENPLVVAGSCTLTALAFSDGVPGIGPETVELVAYTGDTLRAPEPDEPAEPGLRARSILGGWSALSRLDASTAAVDRVVTTIGPLAPPDSPRFAQVIEGLVAVPTDGVYAFFARASGGCRVLVGERTLIDDDGLDDWNERIGEVGLKAGWHPLRIEFVNRSLEPDLAIAMRGPRLTKRAPSPEELGHR